MAALIGIGIGVIAPLFAIIAGFIARAQVQRSGGLQKGSGLALAGIIIGVVLLAMDISILASGGFHCHSTNSQFSCHF